jgi:hypothetical protein
MPIDQRTGQRLPYPGEPGYQGPGGGGGGRPYTPAGGMASPHVQRPNIGGGPVGGGGPTRRRRPAPPAQAGGGPPMGGRIAPAQSALNQPAQAGPAMEDLGNFGALGAVAGIGEPGAVNAASVLNRRRRGGMV